MLLLPPPSTNTNVSVPGAYFVGYDENIGWFNKNGYGGNNTVFIQAEDPNAVITMGDNQYTGSANIVFYVNPRASGDNFYFTVTAPAGNSQQYSVDINNLTVYDVKPSGRPDANIPVKVHTALSPNGDGRNDFLQIDGIEAHAGNHIVILNRSGAKVFEVTGYDNQTKVFNGKSATGAKLPSGTYFYKLSYKLKGVATTVSGYIQLKN